MSRRRTSRRRRRPSQAVAFPSFDGDDDSREGRWWLSKAAVFTMLLLVALTSAAMTLTVQPPSHTGADSEAAADVMHSARAGENTLLRLEPTPAEDGTHDDHRVPYGWKETSSGSLPMIWLKNHLKGPTPPRVAKIVNNTETSISGSWERHIDELPPVNMVRPYAQKHHTREVHFSDREPGAIINGSDLTTGSNHCFSESTKLHQGLVGIPQDQDTGKYITKGRKENRIDESVIEDEGRRHSHLPNSVSPNVE
ncbi:uncharacterized protein LOC118409732 [Branchiostoma floridae]|uniref:Uncharacterized protein LOC118409732 n=1 Tax=Branchiostoma floridae TaxID=7739 RepID=A0A9J7MGZ8_BRAFL|nr:uncharacterized protein LOC118409732 [Branchiostoma floridae]